MNRARYLMVLGLLLLSFTEGCPRSDAGSEEESVAPRPVQVSVVTVERKTLQPTLERIGVLAAIPERTAMAAARTVGTIVRVPILEGESVRVGQPVAELDARLAEAEKARRAAAVDEAKAVLARLENGPRPQEIEVARQEARRVGSAVETQRARVEALKTLHDNDEISPLQYVTALADLRASEAQEAASAAQLALLTAGPRAEDVNEARARLTMAEADLRTADLALDFCTIRSPIDGVVTELHARLGLPVDPALSLATIVDNSHLVARFRVPGWFATGSVAGAPVEMSLTMDPRATFPGSILRVGKQAGASTGDVDALALVANEGRLLPGLGCHVRVLLPPAPDCLVIPLAALSDRDGTAVVTVARDGQAHELTVDIGIVTEREAQVLRGLVEGDLVVVENGYGLPEGCPLEIRFRSP